VPELPVAAGFSFARKTGLAGFGFDLRIFLEAEGVGGLESAGKDVLAGFGEDDVGAAHLAPTAGDGEKNIGKILDEELLVLGGEHEVAVALIQGSQGGEDVSACAEVDGAEVRALFGVGEAEGDAAEVVGSHGGYPRGREFGWEVKKSKNKKVQQLN
jgi:hypothetical protein